MKLFLFPFLMLFSAAVALRANAQCQTSERIQTTAFGSVYSSGSHTLTSINSKGWSGSGPGSVSFSSTGVGFSADNIDPQLLYTNITNANLKGNGATVTITLSCNLADPPSTLDGNSALRIQYYGTTYANIAVPNGEPTSATVTASGGATVSPSSISVTKSGATRKFQTVTINLPKTIQNNGALALRFSTNSNNNNGTPDYLVSSISFKACPVSFSGSVLDDGLGLTDGIVNQSGTNIQSIPDGLFVNLLDNANNVVASSPVSSGAYNFTYIPDTGKSVASSYSLILTTADNSATPGVVAAWAITGQSTTNGGANVPNTAAGGTGSLPVSINNATTNTDKTGFYGIDHTPAATAVAKGPLSNDQLPLSDQTGYKGILSSDPNTAPLSGDPDPEDGSTGASTNFVISTISGDTRLFYNGMALQSGDTIKNYQPGLLAIYGSSSGSGASFTYAALDNANQASLPQTYSIAFLPGTLPITISGFTAVQSGRNALLNWTTSSEINSDRFEIERSVSNAPFEKIGSIKAMGTSSQTQKYMFTDANTGAGTNLYRLKLIDLNGTFAYSKDEVAVTFQSSEPGTGLKLYPNPVTSDILKVEIPQSLPDDGFIEIISSSGSVKLRQAVVAGTSKVEIYVKSLVNGFYFITVSDRSRVLYKGKFIK